MIKIAVISDTHGLLRPEVSRRLAEADVILHAGDVNTPALAELLYAYPDARIVRGNNDKEWAGDLPHTLSFTIEKLRFFMVHKKNDVPADLPDVNIVIYGHSHKYAMENKDGILWLNPGSCGRRRFNQEITFCMMEIENDVYRVEKVTIPH